MAVYSELRGHLLTEGSLPKVDKWRYLKAGMLVVTPMICFFVLTTLLGNGAKQRVVTPAPPLMLSSDRVPLCPRASDANFCHDKRAPTDCPKPHAYGKDTCGDGFSPQCTFDKEGNGNCCPYCLPDKSEKESSDSEVTSTTASDSDDTTTSSNAGATNSWMNSDLWKGFADYQHSDYGADWSEKWKGKVGAFPMCQFIRCYGNTTCVHGVCVQDQ